MKYWLAKIIRQYPECWIPVNTAKKNIDERGIQDLCLKLLICYVVANF